MGNDSEYEQPGMDRRKISDRRSGIDRRKAAQKFVGMDMNKGVERFGGDRDTYYDVLHAYVTNTRQQLEVMENVSEDKLSDYTFAVHSITGPSRGILADMVGYSAEKLENAAKSNDFAYINAHNRTFLNTAWKLIHDLEEMLAEIDAAKPLKEKDKPDREALSKLRAACEAYDMDGIDEAMAEIGNYRYTSDDGLAVWIRENVDLLNIKEIAKRLSELED